MKVLSLPTHAQPRIVSALEELLEKARAGNLTKLFVLYEDREGNRFRENDGYADNDLVFSLRLVEKRILGEYL